jgi:hypothetical protein
MANLKDLTINDTGFIKLPSGTADQRPSPSTGMMRWNTSRNEFEIANNANWISAQNKKPQIVTNGLVLNLDAGDPQSYKGSGTVWSDLSGNGNNFTIDASGFTYNSLGYFNMVDGGISRSGSMATTSTCTCVFWMRTADVQSLFWGSTVSNAYYLGAYNSGNKFYNASCGSPTLFMDTVSKANIYDNIRDNIWHMIEFKSVDFSTWTNFTFNKYSSFTFGDGNISQILMYNRNLSTVESQQNFNATRGRFGI